LALAKVGDFKASGSFLKKEPKNFWPEGREFERAGANPPDEQKFFASFFQKRSACLPTSATPKPAG
jgi:hypothetical protein